ncbi:MAG: hypothetical protein ABII12_16410, partial [Planctomycetota bacterium]
AGTGGCRLTRDQVMQLVIELVQFGNNAAPGLKFNWDQNIEALESDCMDVLPPPFQPCFSQCSLTGVPNNNPRQINLTWFIENIVNQGPGGGGGLLNGNNYINDDCTINIYFVGNVLDNQNQLLAAATIPPNQMGIPDFVFINDLALTSCTNPTDPNQIRDRKTLTHEVVCHWLQRLGDAAHPAATPANPCPQNLCIGGDILLSGPCQGVYNGKRPAQVPTTVQQQIVNLNQGCPPP